MSSPIKAESTQTTATESEKQQTSPPPPPQSQDSGDRITAQTPSTPAPFPGSPSSEDPASEGEFIPPNVNSNTLLVTPASGPSGTTTTTLKIDTRPTRKSSGLHVGTPDIALKISRQIQRKKLTAGALRRAASIRHAQHTARDLSADNTRNLEDVAHQGTHTDTDRPTDTTDTEATPPPLPLTPPPTLTPTPAKNDQYYIVLSHTTSDDNQEGDHTPQESEDEWTTDAESGAREYYQAAKSAIEESKTLKRELRAIAVENLSHLYELVLSLADSRHRHRANLEVERTRSARERVRLLSAQQKELEALTASHRKELKETIQELRLDREAVIGLQKIMEGGMGTIIEAITKQQETRQPESEQQPQPTRETGRAEMGDALRDIKTQLSAIAGEMSLISAREESDSQIKLLEGARSPPKKETGQEPTLHSEIHTHLKRIEAERPSRKRTGSERRGEEAAGESSSTELSRPGDPKVARAEQPRASGYSHNVGLAQARKELRKGYKDPLYDLTESEFESDEFEEDEEDERCKTYGKGLVVKGQAVNAVVKRPQGSPHRLSCRDRGTPSKRHCTEVEVKCSHCGGQHTQAECNPKKAGETPRCINCTRLGSSETAHNAFSACCPVRRKWDSIARARVAYS
ncbi:hypothetical protein ACJJTC_016583 [Scirpophaga incertulas]